MTNIYLFINKVENFVAGKFSSHQRANCSNIDWHELISKAWFSWAFNCIMVYNFTDCKFICMFNANYCSFHGNYGPIFVHVNRAKYAIAFSFQKYTLHHTRDIMHVINIKHNRHNNTVTTDDREFDPISGWRIKLVFLVSFLNMRHWGVRYKMVRL